MVTFTASHGSRARSLIGSAPKRLRSCSRTSPALTAHAAELALVGDPVGAAEALRIGLVSRVVPGDQLMTEARALADRLAEGAPLALSLTKGALERSLTIDLDEALAGEAKLQGIAGASADHAEGLAAFREKRPPRFTGS